MSARSILTALGSLLLVACGLTGRMEETGERVSVATDLEPKAEYLVIELPDGREFRGFFEISNLLRPGQQPPTQWQPENLLPGVEFTPIQYGYEVERRLWSADRQEMTCWFHYLDLDAPPPFAEGGVGLCQAPTGERIHITW
ncbi:hypothetical protein [Geminicoccus flavidas]|uniref:hypothetical protein n=1 Tax=Geminicoccus flavidas TaxID=2506407 RepID=UPI001357E9C3|nr:hypothetical protein [Geminicoccus flavidas]